MSDLVRGSSERIIDGRPTRIDYAYVARRATIFDDELIAWADARARKLKMNGAIVVPEEKAGS